MTAFIIISSRLDPKPSAKRIHAQSWTLMKVGKVFSKTCCAFTDFGLFARRAILPMSN